MAVIIWENICWSPRKISLNKAVRKAVKKKKTQIKFSTLRNIKEIIGYILT